MITFFTIPKPFEGHYDVIQKNAISSWLLQEPKCEIIVFSQDLSTKLVCDEYQIRYIEDFKNNDYGTPLLDGIWKKVKEVAKHDLICYINTDIILLPSFLDEINLLKGNNYFVTGRRWDIAIDYLINYNENWHLNLKKKVKKEGKLHPASGADFFLFPKLLMPDMPKFAIGRAWWDNWIFSYFKSIKVPVVDATEIMTIHQNHDYSHVKSVTEGTTFKGAEREENKKIACLRYWNKLNILDSDYHWYNGKLIKKSLKYRIQRIIDRYLFRTILYVKENLKYVF